EYPFFFIKMSYIACVYFPVLKPKISIFPAFFDCCTEVAQHIPKRWLSRVVKFEIQKSGDFCRIPAVIIVHKLTKALHNFLSKPKVPAAQKKKQELPTTYGVKTTIGQI
uniref:Chemokine interleukin-8-like domain-containing protein n=1 Tax=Laticauda laticaudata TaxID=8630 RepID=A0A8C5RFY0_LATLA